MPPSTGSAAATEAQTAAGLNALLTPTQLTELIALISAITDSMHAQIADAFDASTTNPSTGSTSTTTTTGPQQRSFYKDALDLDFSFLFSIEPSEDEEEEEGRPAEPSERPRTTQAPPSRQREKEREKELPQAGLLDIKSDVLEWFQGWRDGIVGRVVDILNSRSVSEREEDMGEEGPRSEIKIANTGDGDFSDPKPTDSSPSALTTLYPPTPTSLSSLPLSTRNALLSAMLLLVLSSGNYAAPSRILLLQMTSSLRLPLSTLQKDELQLAQGLLEAAKRMSADDETKKRSQENAVSRRWKVGLAGVAGAALIGVTGGLAAPLVAGAIGSVMGGLGLGATAAAGLLGTLGSSGVIVGSLFGAYGFGMTSKMMDQYAKEVEDLAFLPMRKSSARGGPGTAARNVPAEERRLRVTIGVSGWLAEKGDVMRPWRVIGSQSEVFALRWELNALLDMGASLESMVTSAVWAVASRELIARTVFAGLMFAMWPLALLKLSKIVDNPFNVAKNKADKAGLILADAIINKAQGERPVTLIGYSMGARLIYSCLMSLAERRAFGLVESAVLIGAPAPSDASVWQAIRSVVSGRLVNVYSEKDYILAFLYRTSSIQFGVAGIQAVTGVKGMKNVDVSATVSGHLRYPHLVGTILADIGWEDVNLQEVERERHIAEVLDEEEERKTANFNDKASVEGREVKSQGGVNTTPENKVQGKNSGSALPGRSELGAGRDPLGAGDDVKTLTDARIEAALTASLSKYVKQENAHTFRCLVPECGRQFTVERFWRKHVGIKHAKWLEGLKQEARSSAAASSSRNDGRDSEQHVSPTPQAPAPAPAPAPAAAAAEGEEEEEDLISFDENPRVNNAATEKEEEKLPAGQKQQIVVAETPKVIEGPNEKRQLPVRQKQPSRADVPKQGSERKKESHRDGRRSMQGVEIFDYDKEMHEHQMHGKESPGIAMIDNEEEDIRVLEPVPWTGDEDA